MENNDNVFIRLPKGKQISFIRQYKNSLQIGLIKKKIEKIKQNKKGVV